MNNWAVILGSSSGIGRQCAIELAKNKINIFGVYLRKSKNYIEELSDEIKSYGVKVRFLKMNAANESNRLDAINQLKSLDNVNVKIFIHSLAFGTLKPMIDNEENNQLKQKQIEMTTDVMSHSLIYWAQDLFNNNLFNKHSQIIAMTSAGGNKQWKNYGAVSLAKSSLESAIRQLALELAPYQIACNSIEAGVTLTAALEKIPNFQSMVDSALNINPHKRLTLPQDIANAVIMLCKHNTSWITGNTIKVDGGESL